MMKTEIDYIKYKDLESLLNYIFPNIDDWVHNRIIPNLIVNGKKIRLRPAYRSEKLKLIILYDYSIEDSKYIYQKAGYRVVEIPSYMSLSKIKEAFDKKDYTYIKHNKTKERFRSYSIANKYAIDNNTVYEGSIVKVLDMNFDEEYEYELVHTSEIDLSLNKISTESPIGKALLGKKVNQEIEVNTPSGIIKLKILKII